MELLKQAIAFHRAGDLAQAEQLYRHVLTLSPDHPNALCMLGLLASQVGQMETSIELMERAVAIAPEMIDTHRYYGQVLAKSGRLEEAIVCYKEAIQRHPRAIDLHFQLGDLLRESGCYVASQAAYRQVLQLDPNCPEAHNNLGLALQRGGDLDEAARSYHRALQIRSDFVEAHNNYANALQEQGRLEDALQYYQRAIQLMPDQPQAYNNQASILKELGQFEAAIKSYERALVIYPQYAEAIYNLGQTFQDAGRPEAAIHAFQQALQLRPHWGSVAIALAHQLQHVCQWKGLHELSQRAIQAVAQSDENEVYQLATPFSYLGLIVPTTAHQQRMCAEKWARLVKSAAPSNVCLNVAKHLGRSHRKLKIGYLSSDFYNHPTAWLMVELLEKHHRDRFEIFGYSCGIDDGSAMRHRIVHAMDHFRDVQRRSHAATASQITEDGIDILVDLKGYTQGSRTPVFAARPAPIQVNFLGYPGTMGADFIDYILVDDFIVPADQQPYFSERLVHLPGCYQPNIAYREIEGPTPSRIECGLPAEGFVLCSFNNTYKLTPEIFDIWMRLLKAQPTSVLWLLEANPLAASNLRREAELREVAAERLVFAPRLSRAEHLARHRLADLFLDSYPVNAHTTASDALRMGLPILTFAGQTFVSRVAGSLLNTVGLPELITTSYEAYEAMAMRLSHDRIALENIRRRLDENVKHGSLYDGHAFANKIEAAYEAMWDEFVRRESTSERS